MIIKNTVFGFFIFLSITGYSQTQGSGNDSTEKVVTEFTVETDNLKELIDFDWGNLNEMFETNNDETVITLAYNYNCKFELDTTDSTVSNFKFAVTGKTSEINKLIDMSKKSIQKLAIFSEKHKN